MAGDYFYWQDLLMATNKKTVGSKPAPKKYILLTGRDDAIFCQRVSDRMDAGYELYGSPSITFNIFKGYPVVAQALVLKKSATKKKSTK